MYPRPPENVPMSESSPKTPTTGDEVSTPPVVPSGRPAAGGLFGKWFLVPAVAVGVGGLAAILGGGVPGSKSKPANTEAPAMVAPQGAANEPQAAAAAQSLTGVIAEVLQVERYTYLSLKLKDGATAWTAVPKTDLTVGKEVTVISQQEMSDFRSESLKRTFDKIHFGTLQGSNAPEAAGAMPPGHPAVGDPSMAGANPHGGSVMGAMGGAAEPSLDVSKVTPAAGASGKTIAAIFAQRASLSGKTVSVRGVAVKVVSGVMGKNFVHLKDGTGSDKDKTDDLTITTDATVVRGATVLITGAISIDKDFGAGYTYPVIVEDATVKAE
jgi:hypothetical protein